jgi:prepilin-type N-terminal cleavage/methylation domain-containing protein
VPVTRRLLRAARDERGMTLVELLVGSVLGVIVLTAAFQILIVGMKGTQRIQAGVETVQRGRLAMENVTRELRSQICLPTATGPLPAIDAADATTVTFYADLGDENLTPDKRTISFAGNQITEKTYTNTGTVTAPAFGGFPNTPTRTRVLATNIAQDSGTAYLRYYKFSTTDPIEPSIQLTSLPLSATDRASVVQIGITFVSQPTGANADPASAAVMDNKVFVRTSSAADPERSPACL